LDKFYEGPPRCLVYPKLWLTLGDSAKGNKVDDEQDIQRRTLYSKLEFYAENETTMATGNDDDGGRLRWRWRWSTTTTTSMATAQQATKSEMMATAQWATTTTTTTHLVKQQPFAAACYGWQLRTSLSST
jgi:hypothetical protein